LVAAAALQIAEVSRRILFSSQLDGWQLGKSRVFLRAGQLAQLEVRRQHLCVAGRLQHLVVCG
jgi:myosin heavy subunit